MVNFKSTHRKRQKASRDAQLQVEHSNTAEMLLKRSDQSEYTYKQQLSVHGADRPPRDPLSILKALIVKLKDLR
jgi:hypothetical protein